ncbi:MAG: MazG nucleotide pyrophosphohydrolase domain-containing protein [bacterium]
MTFEELLNWVALEDQRVRERFGNYPDEEKRILARTVKLSEELGELCDEVLSFNSMQRQEKLDTNEADNLSAEFADVLITTLLLARVMGVDIPVALERKIEKINKRYEA